MLSTNRPHIHSAACWFIGGKDFFFLFFFKIPASSTFPKQSPFYWVPFPLFCLSLALFLDFCPGPGLCLIHPRFLRSVAALFCYRACSQSPLDSVSKQTGSERVWRGGGSRHTRLLLLATQTWLGANSSTMLVLPRSLPPTEWLSLHVPSAVFSPPTKLALRMFSLPQSCYFAWKRWCFSLMELFSSESTLSGSVGRRLSVAFEWL